MIRGRCLCKRVTFECDGPTEFAAHCHCESCRRAHSAPMVTWSSVPEDCFCLLSGQPELTEYGSSPGVTRSFCAVCGSPMFYRHVDVPGRVFFPVACVEALDRPVESHVCYEQRVPWLEGIESLPCYRGLSSEETARLPW